MQVKVRVMLNVGEDNFWGYRPDSELAEVGDFVVETDTSLGPEAVAEMMWEVGNKRAADANGKRWPSDVRSLSKGDVLVFMAPFGVMNRLAVTGVGWLYVDSFRKNKVVPLAGRTFHKFDSWTTTRHSTASRDSTAESAVRPVTGSPTGSN
jgi:hypothetical protein